MSCSVTFQKYAQFIRDDYFSIVANRYFLEKSKKHKSEQLVLRTGTFAIAVIAGLVSAVALYRAPVLTGAVLTAAFLTHTAVLYREHQNRSIPDKIGDALSKVDAKASRFMRKNIDPDY